jgi:hypothetical protein
LLLYALRGERAAFHVLFENLRNGTVPNLPTGPAKVQASVLGGSGDPDVMNLLMHVPGFLTAQHAAFLRNLNEWIEIAKRPPEEWEALLAQERAKLPNLPILVRLLTPALDRLAQAYLRNHANLRCAIVAVAAERFRQQQKRWPESAGELVQAGLLGAVPTDPYDRKPIKFARTADGLVVYCIGPDGADNGGKIDRQNPFKTGIDFGFQLWDLAARRAPSQPPRPPSPVDGRGPPP